MTYNATTWVVTMNPSVTLGANTQFTVQLSNGITDTAGTPAVAVTWDFRTGA